MKVSDFMTKDVVTLTIDQTVEEAAQIMLDQNLSTLPIVDHNNHLVGILTESDFIGKDAKIPHALVTIKKVLGQIFYDDGIEDLYRKVKHLPLEKVMTRNPHCVSSDETLDQVVALMNSRRLKRIPVVDENVLVGVITRHDVVRAFTMLPKQQDEARP